MIKVAAGRLRKKGVKFGGRGWDGHSRAFDGVDFAFLGRSGSALAMLQDGIWRSLRGGAGWLPWAWMIPQRVRT
jgi:hypothetical protein